MRVWISRAVSRNFTWSVTSCLSYLTLFLETCYRRALGWLGFLFGFDLFRVKECELQILRGLCDKYCIQIAQFPIANVLRVLDSVSCPLFSQSKEVTRNSGNEHSKKIMFCRCLRMTCPTLLDTTQLLPWALGSGQKDFSACSPHYAFLPVKIQCWYKSTSC